MKGVVTSAVERVYFMCVLLLSLHTGNFSSLLFHGIHCCDPGSVQRAWVALRNSPRAASGSDRMRRCILALPFREEHSPEEERTYQDNADEVDTQRPRGLCITAGANTVNSRERKDAQCQHMQTPPQLVADVRAQQGTDANGDAQIQSNDAERHPCWTISAREWNEDLVQTKVGEWIYQDGQDMHYKKDRAE